MNPMLRWVLRVLAIATIAIASSSLLLLQEANARPGGGQSYKKTTTGSSGGGSRTTTSTSTGSKTSSGSTTSGGSRSSSTSTNRSSSNSSSSSHSSPSSSHDRDDSDHHSSSGSNGSLGIEVFIAFGVILAAVAAFLIYRKFREESESWSSSRSSSYTPVSAPPPAPTPKTSLRPVLATLAKHDANFSVVLFEDFLYALYSEVHRARGKNDLETVGAFLSSNARARFACSPDLAEVKGIVVGGVILEDVGHDPTDSSKSRVEVTFESNYTEVSKGGKETTFLVRETWVLTRKKDVLSREPDKIRVFSCTNCGAPIKVSLTGECTHCQKVVNTGDFDWVVESITEQEKSPHEPTLTGTVEEEGTDLPTIVNPDAPEKLRELSARDPQFAWPAFQQRVTMIFEELQTAWSTQEWQRARPFLSDRLYEAQAAWVETYKSMKLRNVTENARIANIQCAAVLSDKFLDAITIRLYASSLDYTIATDNGEVVGGSKTSERRYSEYWTLIRAAGRSAPSKAERVCPNCGAPLKVNMAGECDYCHARVTTGDFDWVLSRIEQDEVYNG